MPRPGSLAVAQRIWRHLRRASLLNDGPKTGLLAEIAYVRGAAGDRDGAVRILQGIHARRDGHVPLLSMAQIHITLGNQDRALEYTEEACFRRDWFISGLKQDTRLDPLRTSPRYRGLLAKVGI
jgi:hypothetical protein